MRFRIMATKSEKAANQSLGDLDMAVNKELITNIKLHPGLWYRKRYTTKDETHWSSISMEMGVQKSWLKRRWHQLRTECNNNTLHNPALAKHLKFLKKITKDGEHADDKMEDDHQIEEGDEFHVTQEQLDESIDERSSSDLNAINFDADNESTDTFEEYEFTILNDAEDADVESNQLPSPETKDDNETKAIKNENVANDKCITSVRKAAANRKTDNIPISLKESPAPEAPAPEAPEMEYQDKVFGDLVAAMIQQMTPEKKKQVKKEIMNILL